MCKQFPGFLRVALADPAPDRKFYRRGWVTFEKLGKIKDIWWQISSMKVAINNKFFIQKNINCPLFSLKIVNLEQLSIVI